MLRKFPVSNAERYSDADLEVSQYLCLHMKIICLRFVIRTPLPLEICGLEICEKFVYKHSETKEYVKIY